jgi:hypothetical protein
MNDNGLCPLLNGGVCCMEKCAWATYDEDGKFMMCAVVLIGQSLNEQGMPSYSPRDDEP